MNDQEFDALDQILDSLRERLDEVPQWEFCEGAIAALICCRRDIPAAEYFGALMGDEDSGQFGPELFASPEQYEQNFGDAHPPLTRSQALIEADRRRLVDENTQLRQELRERYDLRIAFSTRSSARP